MKPPYKLIAALLFIMLILSLIITCNSSDELKMSSNQLYELRQTFSSQRKADSSMIYSQRLNIQKSKLAIDSLISNQHPIEIIKIQTKTITKTEFKIADPIKIDTNNFIKLPLEFNHKERWLTLNGSLDTNGILGIDYIITFSTFTYGIVDTVRKGMINRILNKRDLVVRMHVDNPNLKLLNMGHAYMDRPKPWYQRTLTKVGIGAFLGGLIIFYVK